MFLRAQGFLPWQPEAPPTRVDPGGRLFEIDLSAGYRNLPGRYEIEFLDTDYRWTATHSSDGSRVTASPGRGGPGRPEVWLFGGSFTYGWSLDDAETFPWLVQEKLPWARILNFGVGGYGTLNSLLQFRSALAASSALPELVVVVYASFHDERNTMLRSRRKGVASLSLELGERWRPFARLDGVGELVIQISEVEYREFPLMRHSALAHALERSYNRVEASWIDSAAVSRALMRRFRDEVEAVGARFAVVGITLESDSALSQLREEGIEVASLAVDLELPGYRNLPHDGHPSALANRVYAYRLASFIRRSLPQYSGSLRARSWGKLAGRVGEFQPDRQMEGRR